MHVFEKTEKETGAFLGTHIEVTLVQLFYITCVLFFKLSTTFLILIFFLSNLETLLELRSFEIYDERSVWTKVVSRMCTPCGTNELSSSSS